MSKDLEPHADADKIRGKVAEVVSDRELILNRGSEHGVEAGMFFSILNPNTIGITDPDSGEPLGGIRTVKIVVRAVEVAQKITLARTFRKRTVNVGGSGSSALSSMADFLNPPKYVEQVEKLTIDKNAPRKIRPGDSLVDRGDPFEQAEPEDVEDVKTITVWEES